MGLLRLKRHLMLLVTYFLITIIHKITEAESVKKHIGENCLLHVCATILQKVMAAIFQDGGHFQHDHFLDNFIKTYAILMILVTNHTFLITQNLNFDFPNSVIAYFF